MLVTLSERVLAEADATFEGRADDWTPLNPRAPGATASTPSSNPCAAHLGVALAGVGATATNAEIRQLWSSSTQKWVDRTAAVITAEDVRGAAPDSVRAQDLAAALNRMNERTMFASYTAQKPSIPEEAALDTLCMSGSPASTRIALILVRHRCEHMFVSRVGSTARPV